MLWIRIRTWCRIRNYWTGSRFGNGRLWGLLWRQEFQMQQRHNWNQFLPDLGYIYRILDGFGPRSKKENNGKNLPENIGTVLFWDSRCTKRHRNITQITIVIPFKNITVNKVIMDTEEKKSQSWRHEYWSHQGPHGHIGHSHHAIMGITVIHCHYIVTCSSRTIGLIRKNLFFWPYSTGQHSFQTSRPIKTSEISFKSWRFRQILSMQTFHQLRRRIWNK